jgi:O-antigen ligase
MTEPLDKPANWFLALREQRYSALLLSGFAFSISPSKALGNILLVLLLLAWLPKDRFAAARLLKDPLMRILAVYAAYLAINVGWAAHSLPEYGPVSQHAQAAFELWKTPFAVLIVSWAVVNAGADAHALRRTFSWGLALAVLYPLLLGTLDFKGQPVTLDGVFLGAERTGFAMHNPNSMGLYASFALLSLILFPPPLAGDRATHRRVLGWLGALAFFAAALFATKSRSGWLAFALTAVVVVPFAQSALGQGGRIRERILMGAGLMLILLLIAVAAPSLLQAISPEQESLRALLRGQLDNPEPTSFGQRLMMWQAGIAAWQQHPWLGIGPASVSGMLSVSAPLAVQHHPTLHNSILDVLVTTGILGLAFQAGIFGFLCLQAIKLYFAEGADKRLALLLLGAMALFLVDSLATHLLVRDRGMFFLALFGGLAYGLAVRSRRPD